MKNMTDEKKRRLRYLMIEAYKDFAGCPFKLTVRASKYKDALKDAAGFFSNETLKLVRTFIEEYNREEGIPNNILPESIFHIIPELQALLRERQEMLHLINYFLDFLDTK